MGVLNSEASEEGEIKGKRRNKYLLEGKVRQRMLSGHPPQRRGALPEISSYRQDSELRRWGDGAESSDLGAANSGPYRQNRDWSRTENHSLESWLLKETPFPK